MNNITRLVIFGVVIIAAFTLFSTLYVPDMTPEPPPSVDAPETAPTSVEGLVALGEKVYNGKGACALCHDPVAGRAPVLDDIINVAKGRIKAPGYKGSATDAIGYVYESLVDPSAHVVAGFGVAGTGDAVSPMPDVRSPEIGLKRVEMDSVVAYLERLSGVEVTVKPAAGEAADE